MAIGSKFAYATDKPLNDTIGDAMRYTEQASFKYREEAEKKKAEIAKAKEEQEKLLKPLDDKVTYTPYDSDNAMRFDLANKLRKRIDEASNDVRKGKISQQDWNLINANAKATLDFANQGATNINTQAENVAKLASEGKLAKGSVDEALRLGGAVDNRRINFEINPDGTATTVLFDENNEIIEKGGIDKIGSTIYNPVYNVDYDTELQQFKTANPIDFIETIGNNKIVGVKELTPRLKNTIDKYAEAKLKDKDALINAYYNQTGEFKKDITSPEDVALAKIYIVDKFEGSYNKELNVAEATQGAELRRKIAQDKKDEVVAQIEVVETPPIYGEVGVVPMKGYKTVSVVGGQPIQQITAFDKAGKPITMDTAFLNSYTVTKNPRTGERAIAAEITYPDYKSAGYTKEEKIDIASKLNSAKNKEEADLILSKATKPISYKTKVAYLTEKDASKYLKVGNFKSVNEMKDKARVSEEEQPTTKKVYIGIDPKTGKPIFK
jgi:hypothetical protein